jgi:hypothetical protein
MAIYKYPAAVEQIAGAAFDEVLPSGFHLSISGIYRCAVCGDEIAANKGDPLPPQNHHQHYPGLGPIRWQLTVATRQVA